MSAFFFALPVYANCGETLKPPIRYKDVRSIFDSKCSICHRGPYLDTSVFPFKYDQESDQEVIVQEFIRRMRLAPDNWQKMPTRNSSPMKESEIELIEAWLKGGLAK